MCVVSMVHDHYEPIIPNIDPDEFFRPGPATIITSPAFDFKELKNLIAEFRRLLDAAKLIDEKTNQPDCVDPEKAKLSTRIEELEKIIESPPEFVLVKGGNVEPGRYRVMDGKLYKLME